MTDLHVKQEDSKQIFVDNQAATSVDNDPVFHEKIKHFKVDPFVLIEFQKWEVKLLYCKNK